jgi:hypothetical protein
MNEEFLYLTHLRNNDKMPIKSKRNWLIICSSIVLFSLINVGIAKADTNFLATVLYLDSCPVEGALIKVFVPSDLVNPVGLCAYTNATGHCETTFSPGLSGDTWYRAYAYYPIEPQTEFGNSFFLTDGGGNGEVTIDGSYGCDGDSTVGDYCVDGYCCDTACTGTCEACDLFSNEGTCIIRDADDNIECSACNRCDGTNTNCQDETSVNDGYLCVDDCTWCNTNANCVNRPQCADNECSTDEYCDIAGGNCVGLEEDQTVCEVCGSFTWTGNLGSLACCGNNPFEDDPYESTETSCSDGNDNDCDSYTDCDDTNCAGQSGPGGVTCCQSDINCPTDTCTDTGDAYGGGSCSARDNYCDIDNTCKYTDTSGTDTCGGTNDDPSVTYYYCSGGNTCLSDNTAESDGCSDTGNNYGGGSCSADDWSCSGGILSTSYSSGTDTCGGTADSPSVTYYSCVASSGSIDDTCTSGNTAETDSCSKLGISCSANDWYCTSGLLSNTPTSGDDDCFETVIDPYYTCHATDGGVDDTCIAGIFECSDGLYCTVDDTCQSGVCVDPSPRDCSDANECTEDNCNEELNQCENPNEPSGTSCGLARDCPDDHCNGYFAEFYPDDGHDYCDGLGICEVYDCGLETSYCTDDDYLDGIDNLMCGAECDEDADCGDYCSVDTRYHSGSCDLITECTCSWSTEDCNDYDEWVDTGNTQWVSTGECTEKEQKEQEYRDYTCIDTPSVACDYSVTDEQWVDTGNTRNKVDGTSCNDGLYCTDPDTCAAGVCEGPDKDCSAYDDQCNEGLCDEVGDTCYASPINEGLSCDDTLYCNIGETCQSGTCTGGYARDCSGNDINVAECFYVPDAIDFTYDYYSFASVCDEVNELCTAAPSNWEDLIDHTCDMTQCGAECDSDYVCEELYGSGSVCLENCTCEAVTCPWDVNYDDYVGIDDIVAVAEHFGQDPGHPNWDPKYDVTNDDYVGIDDIVEVAEHFGESC